MSGDKSADLSSDDLNKVDAAQTNLGLEEQLHRRGLQQSAFSVGLSLAAFLFMVAVAFGSCLLYHLGNHPDMHWHASILVAAFIVPPTVIYISVLRAVYKKDGEGSDNVDLPMTDLAKNIVNQLFGLLKKDDKD